MYIPRPAAKIRGCLETLDLTLLRRAYFAGLFHRAHFVPCPLRDASGAGLDFIQGGETPGAPFWAK